MRNFRCATAACMIAVFTPLLAKADSITETFSLTILPAATLTGDDRFPVTPFAQFNPANGTLNDIMTTIAGPATWTSTRSSPLVANLNLHNTGEGVNNGQIFFSTGEINVNFGGTDSFTPDFASLIGTGTTTLDLRLFGSPGDTFATSAAGLQGSITYDFTPGVVVPESSTWAMMLFGFAGLGLAGYRRAKAGQASLVR